VVTPFVARYRGECADCGDRIEPGQQVTYVDDELTHADCADGTAPARRDPGPCPHCWLVHRGDCP
jgi:hypothetical protein